MGAHVVEKHFTLNKNFEGTDHALSADFEDLKEIVENRDRICSALGSGIKKPALVESNAVNAQKKKYFYEKEIKRGEKTKLRKYYY